MSLEGYRERLALATAAEAERRAREPFELASAVADLVEYANDPHIMREVRREFSGLGELLDKLARVAGRPVDSGPG